MNILLLNSYPKLEDGHVKLDRQGVPITVFRYQVTGTATELAEYERVQKLNPKIKTIKDEDGQYLWFTTRPVGRTGKLMISANDKIYADTTQLDLASAMIKQYGLLGQMLAKDALNPAPAPVTLSLPQSDAIDG